jgi:hypothetical protein
MIILHGNNPGHACRLWVKTCCYHIETFMAGSPHVADFAALVKGRFAQSLMDSFGQV